MAKQEKKSVKDTAKQENKQNWKTFKLNRPYNGKMTAKGGDNLEQFLRKNKFIK